MTIIRLDTAHFGELFATIERSSWRWECQGYYAVDEPSLQRWREGHGERGDADDLAWRTYIQGLTARGIPFERVRMVPDPITDYVRYQLETTDWNVDSGEDIRWIDEATAWELDLPPEDFYILDNDRVATFRFDAGKNLLGVDIDDDPAVVARHQAWREALWPLATPHTEYVTTHRSM